MATLDRTFPALTKLSRARERVEPVNGGIVEEVLLPLGQLDFGKGVLAKCDISLWRTRAFQVKFDRKEDIAEKQKKRVAQFYDTLQREVAGWLALGVTKTAMVYRLKGIGPQSHE